MKKIYDLAVRTGSYIKDGIEKGRYENIGSIMEKDDGNKFLFIKRSFNPAGVPFKEGGDSILVSMFKPHDSTPADVTPPVSDDDIPF